MRDLFVTNPQRPPPSIFEDGKQSRDFTSVLDIVRANILAMEKSNADYKVYNVGTGQPLLKAILMRSISDDIMEIRIVARVFLEFKSLPSDTS